MKRMMALAVSLAIFAASVAAWLYQWHRHHDDYAEDLFRSPLWLAKPLAIISLAVIVVLLLRELTSAPGHRQRPGGSEPAALRPTTAGTGRLLALSFSRLGAAFGSKTGAVRIAIGVILNYFPLGALFTLGYCTGTLGCGDGSKSECLPPWRSWRRLFWQGAKAALTLAVYCGPGLALLSLFALMNDTFGDASLAVRLQSTVLYCTLPLIHISQDGVHMLIPNYGQLIPLCGTIALLIGFGVLPAALLLLVADDRVPWPNDARIPQLIAAVGPAYWIWFALSLIVLWPVALLTVLSLALLPLAQALSVVVLALLWSPAATVLPRPGVAGPPT